MNTATRQSVSFEYGSSPQADLDKAIKIFTPYKHKIIGVTEGNHEHRASIVTGKQIGRAHV